jgi:hypothetical protein
LWRAESAEKFLMVLWLAFLEYRRATQHKAESRAGVIRTPVKKRVV